MSKSTTASPATLVFKKLSFDMERQLQSRWCWSATSVSVSKFYNSLNRWTQCKVAAVALAKDCCSNHAACNQDWYLDKALSITGNLWSFLRKALTFEGIMTQINKGNVIGVRIEWPDGFGHFTVIYGYKKENDLQWVFVDDSNSGKKVLSYEMFCIAYGLTGKWTDSYFTKR